MAPDLVGMAVLLARRLRAGVGAGALARAATAPQGRGLAGAGLLAHPAPGKLNAIVKSINEQIDFDALLHTILHESTIIKGIDSALALVREDGTETRACARRGAASTPPPTPTASTCARPSCATRHPTT
jgi:hypothetical protein